MRRLENSLRKDPHIKILSPSLLKIAEPDEEDEFEGNGHGRKDARSLNEKDDCDRRSGPQILEGSEENIAHPPLPIDSHKPGEEVDEMAARESPLKSEGW